MIKPLAFSMGVAASGFLLAAEAPGAAGDAAAQRGLLDRYCVTCHNQAIVNLPETPGESQLFAQLRDVGLTLDTENVSDLSENPALWENVVRKLRVGVMPPPGESASGQGELRRISRLAGSRTRPCSRSTGQSGEGRGISSPQSDRVPERRSRPARSRHRSRRTDSTRPARPARFRQ